MHIKPFLPDASPQGWVAVAVIVPLSVVTWIVVIFMRIYSTPEKRVKLMEKLLHHRHKDE